MENAMMSDVGCLRRGDSARGRPPGEVLRAGGCEFRMGLGARLPRRLRGVLPTTVRVLLLALLLALSPASARELGSGQAQSPPPQTGPRLYRMYRFPEERVPAIDGDLTDWEIVGDGYAQDTYQLIEYNRKIGRGYDLQNLDVRVRAGYNERLNRIYVAVEYFDDYHNFDRVVAPGSGDLGNDDIFEIVVDADRSGDDFIYDLDRGLMSTHTQNYHVYVHERDGEHVWVWGDQAWLQEAPWSQWASRFDGDHGASGLSTLEFYVTPFNYAHPAGPQLSAPARLAVGDTIGYDYSVLDRDADESDVVKFWALCDTILMYRDADFLPAFVLDPPDPRLERLPLVEFRSRAPGPEAPRTVQFANFTRGEVTRFAWDFGDGTGSTERDPAHEYGEPGRYTVTLEAEGPGGTSRRRKLDYAVLAR